MQKVEYLIKWMNYFEKFNSWVPEENIKHIPKIEQQRTPINPPIKVIARYEDGFCLVKWIDGSTSTTQLSVKEAYEIIVNGPSYL